MVWLAMGAISGGRLAAPTTRRNESLALFVPSLTVRVIVAVPLWLASGVTVTVRFEPDPPKMMLSVGISAGLDELLYKPKFSAAASPSLMVNEIAPVDVSSAIIWSTMPVIVGG